MGYVVRITREMEGYVDIDQTSDGGFDGEERKDRRMGYMVRKEKDGLRGEEREGWVTW